MEKRLQKILSETGIASRRKAEKFISEGRVVVSGKVATIGMKADISKDYIRVDGKLIPESKKKQNVYIMMNKPRGVVTTLCDPEGRPTIKDFLKGVRGRVFPVGRLDYDSEGLLLLTNDGDFANSVLHPSKQISKIYLAKIKGVVENGTIEKLKRGVRLEDGMTSPARVKIVRLLEKNSWIEVVICEGRKRQIRRMLDHMGHPVISLRRIGVNGLRLKGLRAGEMRYLTPGELHLIRKEISQKERDNCLSNLRLSMNRELHDSRQRVR